MAESMLAEVSPPARALSLRMPWAVYGACRDSGLDPDEWFPVSTDPLDSVEPRAICRSCPVVHLCGQIAIETPHTVGIWGGLDERERLRLKRRSRRRD